MKRFFSITALILTAAMLASCSENTGSTASAEAVDNVQAAASVSDSDTPTKDPEEPLLKVSEIVYDKMDTYSENNVTLAVMRVGDTYITYTKDRDSWIILNGSMPDEVRISDGGFAFVTADILRVSGGIAGFMGNPSIKKVIDVKKAELNEIIEYCGFTEYDPDERYFSSPKLYNGSLIVSLKGKYFVYREGEPVGIYDSRIGLYAAIGLVDELPGLSDFKEMGSMSVSVFCCEDTVLGYCSNISMSRCWQPILDSRLENAVPGYELSDGQAGYMLNADLTRVNGGQYTDSPLVTSTRGMEYVDYDVIIRKTGMPPVIEGMGEGNAAFDRNINGTWLVFEIDGMYCVYREYQGKQSAVAKYGSFEEAVACINDGTDKVPEETQSAGAAYMKPVEEDGVVFSDELGFSYVENQLLVSFELEADRTVIEELFKDIGAEIVGFIWLTNDYQIVFDRDMSYEELKKTAEMLENNQFVCSAGFNMISYPTTEE